MARKRRHPHPERMVGKGRMRQFAGYLVKLGIPKMAEELIRDGRRSPVYDGGRCFVLILIMLWLRRPSFNMFEPDLRSTSMKKLLAGRLPPKCVDTPGNAAKKMDLESVEALHREVLTICARNKVLRNTKRHGVHPVAIDGLEILRSSAGACGGCLSAEVNTGDGVRIDRFHRIVFALTVGAEPHLLLGLEHQDNKEHRKRKQPDAEKAQGELTAARPLIGRIRDQFPKLPFVFVGDGIYPNGPMFNLIHQGSSPAQLIAVLKKEDNEPMKEAIDLFCGRDHDLVYYDEKRQEHVRVWETEGLETLETCSHPLRVIRAQVHPGPAAMNPDRIDWDGKETHEWWLATGMERTRMAAPAVFDLLRHRWDIENCAFNELTQHWHIKHAYLHHEVGTIVMMYAFMIAYNLFQLFLHRRMRNFVRFAMSSVRVAKEMELDWATIRDAADGFFPPDTS
jgi:hypothetical protein